MSSLISNPTPEVTTTTPGTMTATDKVALDAHSAALVPAVLAETIEDRVAALIAAGTHSGITASYSDAGNALSLTVTASSPANLSLGTATATTLPLTNSNGTGVVLPPATTTAAGLLSAADKTQLTALPATAAANAELIEDTVAALLAAGTHSNITVSYSDNGALPGSISIAGATSGGGTATNIGVGARTATDVPLTSSSGTGVTLPIATGSLAGTMSAADKAKLDTIAAGATATGSTDLSLGTATATTLPLNISTGADVVLPSATTTTAGLLSAADKIQLSALPASAAAFDEQAQDAAAAMIMAGSHPGISVVYNDATGSLDLIPTATVSNLALGTATATTQPVTNSNGTGFTLTGATSSLAGLLPAADKTKLDGIAPGATAYSNEMAQDAVGAAFALGVHTGVTVNYDDAAGSITLNVPAQTGTTALGIGTRTATVMQVTSSTGAAAVLPGASSVEAGLLVSADKVKLDTYPASYVAPPQSNLALGVVTTTTQPITNSDGTGFTLSAATTTTAGLLAAASKVKLDGLTGLPTGAIGDLAYVVNVSELPVWSTGSLSAASAAGSNATTPTSSGRMRQQIATSVKTGPEVDSWLVAWSGDPSNLMTGSITYDANGAITTAAVQWPDGAAGVYTATVQSTLFPGSTDSYTVTYAGGAPSGTSPWSGISKTVTQAAVTRDAAGRVTNRPLRTVA